MGSFRAGAEGGYLNLELSAGGDLPDVGELLSGSAGIGVMRTQVDSDGLDLGDEVYSHAYGALAEIEGLGVGPLDIYITEQQALPHSDEPAESPGLDADLGGLGSARGIHGLSKANWDDEFLAPGVDGELAWVDAVAGDLELLDLGDILGGGLLPLPIPGDLLEWRREEPTSGRSGTPRTATTWGRSAGFGGDSAQARIAAGGMRNTSFRGWQDTIAMKLDPGDRVSHDKYGLGTVVACDGAGPRATATIDFGAAGTVRLMLVGSVPMVKL
jgi:hypothetical protein